MGHRIWNVFLKLLINFRYIGILHVLSVFIVLGISADDMFIFCDTWKETANHHYKSLAHRLSDAYRYECILKVILG